MRPAGVQCHVHAEGQSCPRGQVGQRAQTRDHAGTEAAGVWREQTRDISSPETGTDRLEAGRAGGESWGLGPGKGGIGAPVAGSLPRIGVPCVSSEGKVQPLNTQ